MVFRDLSQERVLEHRSSRTGRWLRERRLRIALWIAVIEGILVVFHAIPRLAALVGAAILIAFYFLVGRDLRSGLARQASWIAAASQAFVALVPLLVIVVGTLALIAVGIIAVLALFVLFADRK